MDKKNLVEGIAIGAVAGVVAGLLLATKSGEAARDEIKGHLEEIKGKLVDQVTEAGELTKDKYDEAVKAIIAEYEAAKKITVEEAKEIQTRLCDGYEAVKGTTHKHACCGKAAATK